MEGTINGLTFDTFKIVPELIPYVAEKHKDKIAVSYYADKTTIRNKTYQDLYADVKKMAYYLQSCNLMNTTVSLIGECSYEWIVSFYAIMWIGANPVLIDDGLSAADTLNLIHLADSHFAILDVSKKRKELLENLAAEEITAVAMKKPAGNITVSKNVTEILEEDGGSMEQYVPSDPDDRALIVYTSGTTGNNKAVELTHRNLCGALAVSYYLAGREAIESVPDGTILAVLPVHHMFQISTGIQTPIFVGGTICIGKGKKYIVQSIDQFKPTILVLVPSVIEMIRKKIWAGARAAKKEKKMIWAMRLSTMLLKLGIDIRVRLFGDIQKQLGGRLRTIISGGAPISNETMADFRAWGIDIYNGYGITECSPVVCCNMPGKWKDGSVGFVGLEPYCEVKIIDEEICVAGDIVMKGYYRNESATAEAFRDGYFRTGDLGRIDKDGFLFITGRKKNLIILGNGENISPEELELIFSNVEGIKDLIVIPKSVGNETILSAVVVPLDEVKDREDLQEYFNQQFAAISAKLPPHKRIYDVGIRRKDFIMSSSGKVKRIKENYEV